MLSMKREDSTLLLGDPRNNRANSFCTSMAGNVDVLRSFVDSMRHLVVEFKHLLTLKPRDLRLKKTDVLVRAIVPLIMNLNKIMSPPGAI